MSVKKIDTHPPYMPSEKNLVWHNGHIDRKDRNRLNGHASVVLWFTDLPGAGKSTLAHAVEKEFYKRGIHAYVLDGDNVRHGLNADLGFERQRRALPKRFWIFWRGAACLKCRSRLAGKAEVFSGLS